MPIPGVRGLLAEVCSIWKNKVFRHTARCSSPSASAAKSPFLIPSEFLLVSSSESGNW